MFWLVIQLINHLFKIKKKAFLPNPPYMEKCSDILKVASVGGGESANLKACHFSHFQFHLCHQRSLLKCHRTFYIYGPLVKKNDVQIFKRCCIYLRIMISGSTTAQQTTCYMFVLAFMFML